MKIIIFIGHHKVGSTSLQAFLAQNSTNLLRAGILYPSIESQGLSVMLAKAIRGHDAEENLPINMRESHNALAFKMIAEKTNGNVPKFHKGLPNTRQMFRTIQSQIDALNPHTVILAAEVFSNFAPISTGLIDRLAVKFKDHDIQIFATLRRVDEYLASWHAQRLRFNHKMLPLSGGGLNSYMNGIHFDYKLMLEGWRTQLPDAQFTIRNYADVLHAGGSIEDFISQSQVAFPEGLLPGKHANTSIHRSLVEIIRRGNRELNGHEAGILRFDLEQLTNDLDLPNSKEIELYGVDERKKLIDNFEPIHRYISDLSGKDLFFPFINEARNTLEIPELDAARDALKQVQAMSDKMDTVTSRDFVRNLVL